MASGPALEFFYDISCPFAYIASTRVEALAARTGARLLWRPCLLGAVYRATEAPQGAAGSASDVFNSTKKTITSQAFRRTLRRFDITYNEPPKHPVKTTAPLRLLYYIDEQHRPELTHALYKAYWVDGKDVSDKSVLSEIARQVLGSAATKAIEDGSFENDSSRKQLEIATNDVVERGSTGVPAFWVAQERWTDSSTGKRHTGRLYWGQDRMHFVEASLNSITSGGGGKWLGSGAGHLLGLMPRCTRSQGVPDGEEVKLQFWYDFSSPWAFLGWTQLGRLQQHYGSRLEIEFKPFLLGILFREIGAPNTPGSVLSKQKQRYNKLDHNDWVNWWNAVNEQDGRPEWKINFHWADKFPIRTPTALRAVLVEPKLIGPLYRGCWEDNSDMSSDGVVKKVIDNAGFDGEDILSRASSAEFKSDLRRRTAEAKEAGLCGVPSYRVFRRKKGESEWTSTGDIVWGQDELPTVEDLIEGWDGKAVARVADGAVNKLSSRL